MYIIKKILKYIKYCSELKFIMHEFILQKKFVEMNLRCKTLQSILLWIDMGRNRKRNDIILALIYYSWMERKLVGYWCPVSLNYFPHSQFFHFNFLSFWFAYCNTGKFSKEWDIIMKIMRHFNKKKYIQIYRTVVCIQLYLKFPYIKKFN